MFHYSDQVPLRMLLANDMFTFMYRMSSTELVGYQLLLALLSSYLIVTWAWYAKMIDYNGNGTETT